MNYRWAGLILCVGCMVLGSQFASAEEKAAAEAKPLEDVLGEVPQFVRIIEEFGHGNLDNALDLIETQLPRPFSKGEGPFEVGVRDHWRNQFSKLAEMRPRFDSVDLVGYQPVSSASRTLVFIGHGEFGPILFRFRTYRYRDQWKINGLSYQASWEQIEGDSNFTRLAKPIHYPASEPPVVETDD